MNDQKINEAAQASRDLMATCALRRARWEHLLGDGDDQLGRRFARLLLDAATENGVNPDHLTLLFETREEMSSQEAAAQTERAVKEIARMVSEVRELHPGVEGRAVVYLLAGYRAPPTLAHLRELHAFLLAARDQVITGDKAAKVMDENTRELAEQIKHVESGGRLPPVSLFVSPLEAERRRARIEIFRPSTRPQES